MYLRMAYSLMDTYVAAHPDPSTIETSRDFIDGDLQRQASYQALSRKQRGTVHQNVSKRLKAKIGAIVMGRQKAPEGSSATSYTKLLAKKDGTPASQE